MTELNRYTQSVMKQPDRESRRAALEKVPAHLRDRVKAEVEHRWKRKKGKRK